jgi:hypothetical protein
VRRSGCYGVIDRLVQPQQSGSVAPLWNKGRSSGIHIQGSRGTGKGVLQAAIALGDFLRGIPVVLFEVQGGLVEHFLWYYMNLEKEFDEYKQQRLPDIRYVDMSGKSGQITGWPLLYKLPGDSLYQVSQRFVDLILRLDPELSRAPIMGAGNFTEVATYAGMALFAMGCQLTEAIDLLAHPERWTARLKQAAAENREARRAITYFLEHYSSLPESERRTLILTFTSKLAPFPLDPSYEAMFGAPTPGIDWDEVVKQRQLVILDFTGCRNDSESRFKMRWCFSHLWEYIKQRQFGRDKPISIILDEFSYLLSMKAGSDDLLAADLDNFINKDMRYRNIWLTVAHQELYQIPDRIKKTLLSMGTQILGSTADRDGADIVAKNYFKYKPYWVKKTIPHYAVTQSDSRLRGPESPSYQIIKTHETTEEFTIEEQFEIATQQFMNVGKFHFLMAHSGAEGSLSRDLQQVNIEHLTRIAGPPNQKVVAQAREFLTKQCGRPIGQLTEEIEQRLPLQLEAARSRLGTHRQPVAQSTVVEDIPPALRFTVIPKLSQSDSVERPPNSLPAEIGTRPKTGARQKRKAGKQ